MEYISSGTNGYFISGSYCTQQIRRHLSTHKLVHEFSEAFGIFIISSVMIGFMICILLFYLMIVVGLENVTEFSMWTGNACQVLTR